MKVAVASAVTPDITEIWLGASRAAKAHRGGEALLETIHSGQDDDALLASAVAHASLWIAIDNDHPVGLALCRHGVLEVVFVKKKHRREGHARRLVQAIVENSDVLDAYALPGDRATKSLYESFGWKARLLTMRGE